MTVDERLVAGLLDVLAIQCECAKCGTAISYPVARWHPKEMQCPGCSQFWWLDKGLAESELDAVAGLAQSLRALVALLRANAATGSSVRIGFEISRPAISPQPAPDK